MLKEELKDLPAHVHSYPAFLLRLYSQYHVIFVGDYRDNYEGVVCLHRRLRRRTLASLRMILQVHLVVKLSGQPLWEGGREKVRWPLIGPFATRDPTESRQWLS